MTQKPRLDIRIYAGPSLLAPFAAVVADFACPFPSPLPAARLERLLTELLPTELRQHIKIPSGGTAFEDLVALLTNALHDLVGSCDLPLELKYTDTGTARLILGYYDAQAALRACGSAVQIAHAVFATDAGGPDHKKDVAAAIQPAVLEMIMRQPDFIARALMRTARARGIPVYAVSPGSRIWRYGQGLAGWNFFEAANHRDSYPGSRLVRDKVLSNQLVRRLGLPGVEHGIASSPEAAVRIAGHLGFPVVVKPIDRSKGQGVSANITTVDELRAAFAKASPLSDRGVIVERHVLGDDHRLAVFGGKLKWAIRRLPPQVFGNGENTIAELIDLENEKRSDADVAAGFVSRLVIDTDMLTNLAKQGLSVEDRPAIGHSIALRSNSNTATGGTISDCTASVHPDNRELAETIARSFHLDALGIDFITTDIAKSWRELTGAVIEINSTPGFSSDDRADIVLADKFPPGVDGRLPSIVLIGEDLGIIERVTGAVEAHINRVGQTDGAVTSLAGRPRCGDTDTLPARVLALLLDASCEALVIGATPQEIERHGFPLDRCDLALIVEPVSISADLRTLIDKCAREIIADVSSHNFDQSALPSIAMTAARTVRQ